MQGKKHTQNWKAKISMQKKKNEWMLVSFASLPMCPPFLPPFLLPWCFLPLLCLVHCSPSTGAGWWPGGSQDLGVLFLPCLFVLSVFHSYRLGIKRHPDPTGSLYACYLQRIIWTASGRNLGKSVNFEFCSLSSQTFHLTCILFSHFFYCLPHFPLQSICCYSPWI